MEKKSRKHERQTVTYVVFINNLIDFWKGFRDVYYARQFRSDIFTYKSGACAHKSIGETLGELNYAVVCSFESSQNFAMRICIQIYRTYYNSKVSIGLHLHFIIIAE